MKTDIFQKIEVDFKDNRDEAIRELKILDAKTKGMIDDDIIRAVIYLSNGSLVRLKEIIVSDLRNICNLANDGRSENDTLDFSKTFHELKLIKKS